MLYKTKGRTAGHAAASSSVSSGWGGIFGGLFSGPSEPFDKAISKAASMKARGPGAVSSKPGLAGRRETERWRREELEVLERGKRAEEVYNYLEYEGDCGGRPRQTNHPNSKYGQHDPGIEGASDEDESADEDVATRSKRLQHRTPDDLKAERRIAREKRWKLIRKLQKEEEDSNGSDFDGGKHDANSKSALSKGDTTASTSSNAGERIGEGESEEIEDEDDDDDDDDDVENEDVDLSKYTEEYSVEFDLNEYNIDPPAADLPADDYEMTRLKKKDDMDRAMERLYDYNDFDHAPWGAKRGVGDGASGLRRRKGDENEEDEENSGGEDDQDGSSMRVGHVASRLRSIPLDSTFFQDDYRWATPGNLIVFIYVVFSGLFLMYSLFQPTRQCQACPLCPSPLQVIRAAKLQGVVEILISRNDFATLYTGSPDKYEALFADETLMQFPDDEQARAVQAANATLAKAQAVPPAYAAVTTDLIKRIRRPDNEALSRLEMLKKASAHLVQDRLAKRKKQAASVAFWSRVNKFLSSLSHKEVDPADALVLAKAHTMASQGPDKDKNASALLGDGGNRPTDHKFIPAGSSQVDGDTQTEVAGGRREVDTGAPLLRHQGNSRASDTKPSIALPPAVTTAVTTPTTTTPRTITTTTIAPSEFSAVADLGQSGDEIGPADVAGDGSALSSYPEHIQYPDGASGNAYVGLSEPVEVPDTDEDG